MRKLLHHPIRSVGAALTLVGVLAAVILVVASPALGGAGKDKVSYYTNEKGNVIHSVGEDYDFVVNGTNLNKAVEVFCYAGKDADDGTGIPGFDTVTSWTPGPTSKTIVDVDMDPDCQDLTSAIMVEFEHGVLADPTDDNFVTGPPIRVKPS